MFLDKGHKKEDRSPEKNLSNSVSRLDVESVDQHLIFISQKSEKIAAALYMITDFLKDNEPLKWEMRKSALRFMSFIDSFQGVRVASEKERFIQKSLPILSHLLSLLRFAVSLRFISQMNYSILRDECASLYDTLYDRLQTTQPVDGLLLPQDFFELKGGGILLSRDSQGHNKRQDKGQSIGQSQGHDKGHYKGQQEIDTQNKEIYDNGPEGGKTDLEQEKTIEKTNTVSEIDFDNKKKMRQDIILKLLKTRGNANIKDIADVISDCGEKTIQRELASLIQQGLVKKTGERRWSVYALVRTN